MSPLSEYLQTRGNASKLARDLGITHAAVGQWQGKCPAERVVEVERITGIPREALRPDLYRRAPANESHGAAA
jgi:DNA-binding transcriptional regulator YdaS (Cro superfamily)